MSREWSQLTELPARQLRVLGLLRAIPFTLISVSLIFVFWVASFYDVSWTVVMWISGVYHALPLWLIVVRIPLSLFAPAPDLPVWGALGQVLLVFGLAEVWLGWRRTLLFASLINAVTTLSASLMVFVGLHFYIGTPQADAYQLDTGPSTAVVALAVYVGLRCRAYLATGLVLFAMLGEAVILPNLAGREHMVAVALGFVCYGLGEHAFPRLARRWHAGAARRVTAARHGSGGAAC